MRCVDEKDVPILRFPSHQTTNQRKRLRFEKEEQRRERSLTYKISRNKRCKACSDVAQRVGFEPTCGCPQTDFESCSHLALSCLLWSVAAVLETAKILVLQQILDAPTGIDQLHIRKNQSSN